MEAKSGAAELKHHAINDGDWPQSTAAVAKEWKAVVGIKAVAIIAPAEAEHIWKDTGERIITSRILLRWKPTEQGVAAKARRVVH
eukprot:7792145-Pyramimonas_sp.AAC.1